MMAQWNAGMIQGWKNNCDIYFCPSFPVGCIGRVEIAARVKLFGKHLKAEFDAAAYIVRSAGSV
jgi:hypothetical protein